MRRLGSGTRIGGRGGCARTPKIAIEPMTSVATRPRSGYFSDPYPIHFAGGLSASAPPSFSGTTKAILASPGNIRAERFQESPLTVSAALWSRTPRRTDRRSVRLPTTTFSRTTSASGTWPRRSTSRTPAYPDAGTWNVIVHAHPADGSSPAAVPTDWVADTVLVGSFVHPAEANYDGKYFEDGGSLYLIYSMTLFGGTEDGIVAQPMQSPTRVTPEAPTLLIDPDGVNGGFNSEYYFGLDPDDNFKLIETGNITKIQGKYVLAYSTGSYLESDYKAGVAWSDTFLPAPGKIYKKMMKPDTTGVWGQPNHMEVQYLLQSQESAWPNYVADQVIAPGVPSIVEAQNGDWYLCFAGYAPSDAPVVPATGYYDPSHRRPFFVKLQITIPDGASVATTSPSISPAGSLR